MGIRKIIKTLKYSGWAVKTLAQNGWPRKLIFYNSGIGDDLLCTTVARELRKRNSGRIWVGTKHSELFQDNPDANPILISDWRIGPFARMLGADVVPLWYTKYDAVTDIDPEPPMHIAAMMCQAAAITGEVRIRPYLLLRNEEGAQGEIARDQIAIQCTTLAAATPLQNKEWFPERFQSLVNSLSHEVNFVQLGAATDPKLDNVIDLRGKTTLRQAGAILSRSRLFVGLVGGLMHLARAVECPAVIVYGGREQPEISGYICNTNISARPPCSPCWRRNTCDHNRICMTAIGVDAVSTAVRQMLDRRHDELPAERIFLR
jgi:ADP-heptose:LPS heptosyltransferase